MSTRGQPGALEAVSRMISGTPPHAVMLVGPPSTGKTTLAMDLAAGLLCVDPDTANRPCGSCRGCRQVASGNHPDVHRLVPEGPGGQIRLGRPGDPEPGTVRRLVADLSRLPVEGGARVAVVEAAHRLNEDAQNALLKTLEEPPAGVTLVLCVDDEDRLLPTVRSRCARVRLGPVATRAIEELLAERASVDPPAAARFARLSWGRPGLALAYAATPEAAVIRDEISRRLLDLLGADRRGRLVAARDLLARSAELADLVGGPGGAGRGRADVAVGDLDGPDAPADRTAGKASPAARRRAAQFLLDAWRDIARDLAVAARGGRRELRDPALMEEMESAAEHLPPGSAAAFLARLEQVEQLLDQNANPELAVDVLALFWPRISQQALAAATPA